MRYQAALLPDWYNNVRTVADPNPPIGLVESPHIPGWRTIRSLMKAGGPGGTRTPDLAVMSGQL
jgi:hypothetical protein